MASPPYGSPALALSPPNPSSAQLPNKKRSSPLDVGAPPPVKRRKPSSLSQSSSVTPAHPLRQTSFPPEASSPHAARSPSFDAASSAVSGSAVSTARKKRPSTRKSKTGRVGAAAAVAGGGGRDGGERTPSLVGGKAATAGSGADKDPAAAAAAAAAEDEEDEKEELALEDVVARTQEQKQEEIRLRAMLVEAFDAEQYNRYEMWRAAKLSDAVVKRVVNATVSQSVPQMVSTAVKAVAKLFAGEIIEAARKVQGQWIAAGEVQSEVPAPGGEGDVVDEDRRGPLRPDHLREAWRRYKMSGESHGVGMQQLWHAQRHDGVDRFSTRPTSASAIRIRENQRRSRARRKEYVESMERRIQEYEKKGVEATLEMQQAARTVALENGRLRLMLAHMGAGASDVEAFLEQLRHRDAAHALSTVFVVDFFFCFVIFFFVVIFDFDFDFILDHH
ncbi:hypothetical protein CP532_3967 [Ophiocordyceps camponoti-leonardi (nom. inval.)]|nr:hypothetical protein CP532_3967 [Ophiocordyceps camponoti-leonardi (nom. inval.)]